MNAQSNNTQTNNATPKNEEIENFSLEISETKGLEFPEIEDGAYSAIVEKIGLKPNISDGKGGFFDMLVWHFVVDDNGTMKFIQGTSSAKMTTMSKAFAWVNAITGKVPEIGKSFNPKDLKDMKCQVVVKNVKIVNDFNGQKTEQTKPEIKEVLKAKKTGK
jgi:hypothetical protein